MYHISKETSRETEKKMWTKKRIIILIAVILAAAVLGRLAVRAVIDLMVGGSLFGGNFL